MDAPFRKVRFTSPDHGATAGIIIDSRHKDYRIGELSRLFPITEWRKMRIFQKSPPFDTWEQAFAYSFPSE